MKKVLFSIFALGMAAMAAMAQDDVYFVPTKKAIQKERQNKRQNEQTVATADYASSYVALDDADTYAYNDWADGRSNGTWDVDAYNRRSNTTHADTLVKAPAEEVQNDQFDDCSATARIVRFRSPRGTIISSTYYNDYIVDIDIYDPWYYSSWYAPIYDPWYSPWYYNPWHHGWISWYSPLGYHNHWGWAWNYGYNWGWNPYCYWGGPHGWDHYYWDSCWGWTTPGYNPGWGGAWTGRSNGRLSGPNFSRTGSAVASRGTTSIGTGSRSTTASRSNYTGNGSRTFGTGRSTSSTSTRFQGTNSRTTTTSRGGQATGRTFGNSNSNSGYRSNSTTTSSNTSGYRSNSSSSSYSGSNSSGSRSSYSGGGGGTRSFGGGGGTSSSSGGSRGGGAGRR